MTNTESRTVAASAFGFTRVLDSLGDLPSTVGRYRELTDEGLLAINRDAAKAAHAVATQQAFIAAVIAERSTHDLGAAGLAQREGFRTTEQMIKNSTGVTALVALTSVRTGVMMAESEDDGKIDEVTGEVSTPAQPWLRPVAFALAGGFISVEAAGSITRGLGDPNSAVTSELLEAAATGLAVEASLGVDPDELFKHARAKRDELDIEGVKIREGERIAARIFKMWVGRDGMTQVNWRMDPEAGSLIKEVYDRLTSPKLGSVRFVNEEQAAQAEAIKNDERTAGQLASDGVLHLILAGADADSSHMLGSGAPIIRITSMREVARVDGSGVEDGAVSGDAVDGSAVSGDARPAASRPIGRIDGVAEPVSAETVDRLLCGGKTEFLVFDQSGHLIETEKEQRLFSPRQREFLSAKFGGCMDPNCDRPPLWSEAHHIQFFKRDGGKTEVRNGILLCKYHHLKYHNEHFEIKIDSFGKYWLIPPPEKDPAQTPIAMPFKVANIRDLELSLGLAS
jgi:hypothetical protein